MILENFEKHDFHLLGFKSEQIDKFKKLSNRDKKKIDSIFIANSLERYITTDNENSFDGELDAKRTQLLEEKVKQIIANDTSILKTRNQIKSKAKIGDIAILSQPGKHKIMHISFHVYDRDYVKHEFFDMPHAIFGQLLGVIPKEHDLVKGTEEMLEKRLWIIKDSLRGFSQIKRKV